MEQRKLTCNEIFVYVVLFQRKRKMDELSSKLSDGEEKQSTMRTEIKKAKIGKEQTVSLITLTI